MGIVQRSQATANAKGAPFTTLILASPQHRFNGRTPVPNILPRRPEAARHEVSAWDPGVQADRDRLRLPVRREPCTGRRAGDNSDACSTSGHRSRPAGPVARRAARRYGGRSVCRTSSSSSSTTWAMRTSGRFSMGRQGYTTPNLDRLAHEGRRFTDFYVTQAVCSASRAASDDGVLQRAGGDPGGVGARGPATASARPR